jgi:hypothetical protein
MVLNASSGVPPAFAQLDSRRSIIGVDGVSSVSAGAVDGLASREAAKDHDRLRKLEMEVLHLKSQLARQQTSLDGSTVATTSSPFTQKEDGGDEPVEPTLMLAPPPHSMGDLGCGIDKTELRFFRGKEFRTRYFGPHNASMAFVEVCVMLSSAMFKTIAC